MQGTIDPVQQFLALSELYLKITGKTAPGLTHREPEEILDTVNGDEPRLSPEQYPGQP